MRARGRGRGVVALAGLFLSASNCAFALNPALDVSQYAHTAWKVRDGFGKGEFRDVVQTTDGYLWLGSSFGLSRFDGVRNVAWQPPPGRQLPSSYIGKLLAGRDGTLWIGTHKGLASWKTGQLTEYPELAGLVVDALVEDRKGSIWVGALGSPEGKLCEIDNGGVHCHPEIAGLGNGVVGLHEDPAGNLWIGILSGVWRWKPGPPQFYPVAGEPNGIRGMADGEGGALLISTSGAVRRLVDGKAPVAFPLPERTREFSALRMLRDRDGGLWVGTSGRGIVHIHQGRTDVFSQSDGLSGDQVSRLFEDREGSVWVATVNGLDRFRELPVVTYSTSQGLSNRPNGAVLGGRDGSIWFVTHDGLDRLNRGQLTVYRNTARHATGVREIVVSGLPYREFGSLLQDSLGRIWVSTNDGTGYLENDRYRPAAVRAGVVHALAEDSAGNLWIAHQEAGLVRLSPAGEVRETAWTTLGHTDSGMALAADPLRGGLWVGFYGGGVVYFRDGQVVASYSAANGLAGGWVMDLRFDDQGALWAATETGLSRLKDGRLATLTRRNGLPCDGVQWTIEDAQSVWLNMPCGLARVARSELDAWAADPTHRIQGARVFDSSDGAGILALPASYTPHAAKSLDGRLWFQAPDGISTVDSRHLPFNKLEPPVHIEKITADGKEHDLTPALNGKLRLPPLVRDLAIDYTALSLVAPEKVRFRYRLEGHDPDWRDDAANRRQATYNDLAPRHYRFRVIAANESGVWNETGAAFDFSIDPKFYQTGWFQASCAGALLAMLWGAYRLRLRYLAAQFNRGLEARVNERTRIARDLHDTLLQSFQGVLLKFHSVTYMLKEHPEAKARLEGAIEQARDAITEGRDAVQALRSSSGITEDLARAITTLGEGLVAEQGHGSAARFHVYVEGEARRLAPLVRDEIYRIASEALRNAFQHAGARRIEVDLHYDKRELRLRIRDDGQGIDPNVLAAGGRAGHHGLPGMHERAKLAGARLAIWSKPGAGTEIELTISASIAYAKASEGPA